VLAQYYQRQVTIPRLLILLQAFGILISKRQLVRLLIARVLFPCKPDRDTLP
jgi:hypothetical protein